MKKQDLVFKVLQDLGYKPEIDEDGDVRFACQMKTLYAMIRDEDEAYLTIMYPQFYEIGDGEDALVLAACNKVTREVKMIKAYIDQTYRNVTASCEFFYSDEKSLKLNVENSLTVIGVIRTVFLNAMADLKA